MSIEDLPLKPLTSRGGRRSHNNTREARRLAFPLLMYLKTYTPYFEKEESLFLRVMSFHGSFPYAQSHAARNFPVFFYPAFEHASYDHYKMSGLKNLSIKLFFLITFILSLIKHFVK
ncbi:hypothetical protein [Lentibacillus salinarum]|uniref:Uncharacterized protein n=1 Tax=Lentibacillus salinarum TaxID=446820 RepID=A0ABW3ZUG7_9BACI